VKGETRSIWKEPLIGCLHHDYNIYLEDYLTPGALCQGSRCLDRKFNPGSVESEGSSSKAQSKRSEMYTLTVGETASSFI
jgi:hypothetical protein